MVAGAFFCFYPIDQAFAALEYQKTDLIQSTDPTDYSYALTQQSAPHTDSSGNLYVTGQSSGTLDFDSGSGTDIITHNGEFLTKFDSSGNYLWTKTWTNYNVNVTTVGTDSSDNVYIIGSFSGNMDLDPGAGSDNRPASTTNIFIIKLDSGGDYVSGTVLASSSNNDDNSSFVDATGNIYIVGQYNGTLDFDPAAGSQDRTASVVNEGFVAKYNASLSFQWVGVTGASGFFIRSVGVDSSGNVYAGGSFFGTKDFDFSGSTNNKSVVGIRDGFLLKMNSSGVYQWVQNFGGSNIDAIVSGDSGIVVDSNDNILLSSEFRGSSVDFDPGAGTAIHSSVGESDLYVSSFQSDGTFNWNQVVGGPGIEAAAFTAPAISLDSSDNVYFSGTFARSVDFDITGGTDIRKVNSEDQGVFGSNIFVSTYDNAGNYLEVKTFGGNASPGIAGTAIFGNKLSVVGYAYHGVDHDPDAGVNWIASPQNFREEYFISTYDIVGVGDFRSPVRTDGAPYVTLDPGTASSTLALTTDENATCKYDTVSNIDYASMTSTFSVTGGVSHTQSLSGLSDGTSYSYKIRCIDESGNENTYDYTVIFSVEINSGNSYEYKRVYHQDAWDYTDLKNVINDSSGNTYTFGQTDTANIDMDPGPNYDFLITDHNNQSFFTKYASDGTYEWTKTFGESQGRTYPVSIQTDAANNFYIIGSTNGDTVDFDPGAGIDNKVTQSGGGFFVSKFDATGNYIETIMIDSSTGYLELVSATMTKNGDMFFSGNFNGTIDFDPGVGTEDLTNAVAGVFIAKYDSSGNYQWAIDTGTVNESTNIAVDENDSLYISGSYISATDFDPSPADDTRTPAGSVDTFLSKFSAIDGTYQWTRTIGGTSYEYTTGMVVDASNRVYLSGNFGTASLDFDGTAATDIQSGDGTESGDVFLSSYNSDGSYNWTRVISGPGYEEAAAGEDSSDRPLAIDDANNIYITGLFEQTVDFDSTGGTDNHTSNGSYDIFISGFESNGNYIMTKTFGGIDYDESWGVSTFQDMMYIVGTFPETVDFDPEIGSSDTYQSNNISNYNYFLSTFEIPYTPPIDTSPPTRSFGSPSGTLTSGTTTTNLTLTTDENATCKYDTVSSTAYASMSGTFATTGTASHLQNLTGLTDGTSYIYYVRCIDTSTNANTDDYTISFSVDTPADTTPPIRSFGAPSSTLASGTTSIAMTLTTNENATCKYDTVAGTAYASMLSTFGTTGGTSHSEIITSLSDGMSHSYYVRCIDGNGNASPSDYAISFSIASSPSNPVPDELDEEDTDSGSRLDAPKNVSAKQKSKGVVVTWEDKSQGEEGFFIYRRIEGGEYEKIATVERNTNQYTDRDELTIGESYTYKLKTFYHDKRGEYSDRGHIVIMGVEKIESPIPPSVNENTIQVSQENKETILENIPKEISQPTTSLVNNPSKNEKTAEGSTVESRKFFVLSAFTRELTDEVSQFGESLIARVTLIFGLLTLSTALLLHLGLRESFHVLSTIAHAWVLPVRRYNRKYGIVFDAATGKPLTGARVIVNNGSERSQTALVSGTGMYVMLVPEGTYTLSIEKEGYIFNQGKNHEQFFMKERRYYTGESIVFDKPDIINLDIPMEAVTKTKPNAFLYQYRLHEKMFVLFSHTLFYAGFVFALFLAVFQPSIFNIGILTCYLAIAFFDYIGMIQTNWGEVRLAATKQTAPFSSLILRDESGSLYARTIADEYGRYYLISEAGQYSILAEFQEKKKILSVALKKKFSYLSKRIFI